MFGGLPTSLIAFSVYLDAVKDAGVVDIELPNIQFMTDTLSGAGISGEVEVPLPGLVQAMSMKIKKRAVNKQFTTLLAPRVHNLAFRGIVAMADPGHPTLKMKNRNIRIVANVMPKGKNLGKGEIGKSMDSESEFSVLSIRVFVDEIPVTHIDPFNSKFMVDGIEYIDEDDFL